MNKIASRLKSLRGSESQKDFASRFGVNQTTYSRWELGQTEPSLDMVMRICGVMRVSADWLVGLSEERMPAACAPGTKQGGEENAEPPFEEVFHARFLEATSGMGIGTLSEDLGISLKSAEMYMSGEKRPSLKEFRKLCVDLGVEPAFLLGLSDDPQTAAGATGTGKGGEFARRDEVQALRDEVKELWNAVKRIG